MNIGATEHLPLNSQLEKQTGVTRASGLPIKWLSTNLTLVSKGHWVQDHEAKRRHTGAFSYHLGAERQNSSLVLTGRGR